MVKTKFIKVILAFTALTLALPVSAVVSTDLSTAELTADSVSAPMTSDTIRFVMTAKWGFVRGNPDADRTTKDYSGSISSSNSNNAKVRLVKKLLFEKNDSITSKLNPVSWTSKIDGHWDGVQVAVTAKASETITVVAGQGSSAKTAQEWFTLKTSEVVDLGNNEMLVIKIHPAKRLRHSVLIWWGAKHNSVEPATDTDIASTEWPKVDFSGSLTMDDESYVKLLRTLRFESNDSINEKDRDHINWTSHITSGRDGLATLFVPGRAISLTDGFTLSLPNLDSAWSKHYSFEELIEGSRETVTIGDKEYIVVVGKKNFVKKLIRNKKNKKLYMIDGNVKQYIPSTAVLDANGLSGEDPVEMTNDELEAFEQGDNLNYPDGTVLEQGNSKYIVGNGVKRLLKTSKIASRIKSKLLKRLQSSELSNFETGPEVNSEDEYPDGSLVKTSGSSAVWMIRGGKRQVFSNLQVFNLHKKSFDSVQSVTKDKLQSYGWAPPVEYPDGSLVKAPTDPKVYLIKGGTRHWIESENDFKGLGYKFSQIRDLPDTELVNYPEGDTVIGDEISDVAEY